MTKWWPFQIWEIWLKKYRGMGEVKKQLQVHAPQNSGAQQNVGFKFLGWLLFINDVLFIHTNLNDATCPCLQSKTIFVNLAIF